MNQQTIKKILKDKKWVVNGVEIPLTDLQLKQFESLVEKPKHKHKMSKPILGQQYCIVDYSSVDGHYVRQLGPWNNDQIDCGHFGNGNCYVDTDLSEQVAMNLNLTAKLRKFTYDNGWNDKYLLDGSKKKYRLLFDCENKRWYLNNEFTFISYNEVYFETKELSLQAIKEIVIPFCKENPTYIFNIEK